MSDLPSTIISPAAFLSSPAAGFDGVFDWSWTNGCFGETNIKPMDIDGMVERNGNFLVFETKDIDKDIPTGQLITLRRLYALGVATILLLQGKRAPERGQAWCQPGFKNGICMDKHAEIDVDRARGFVKDWYEFADRNPQRKVDVSFLHRRITHLSGQVESARQHAEALVAALRGKVDWL